MKKNGFIATSLMFSFFLIFLTLTIMVLASYTQYQSLINTLNSNVLKDLNDNVISKKYTTIYNSIIDGDFQSIRAGSFNTSAWATRSNVIPTYDRTMESVFMRMSAPSSKFTQKINSSKLLKTGNNRKIYIRYYMSTSTNIKCSSTNAGAVIFRVGSNSVTLSDTLCNYHRDWERKSQILTINVNSNDQELIFQLSGVSSPSTQVLINNVFVRIRDIMVVDVTDLYKSGTNDESVKNVLDSQVNYFDDFTYLERI